MIVTGDIYKDGKLIGPNVTGDLNQPSGMFVIRDARGIPMPGSMYEMRLPDGRVLVMRAGAPEDLKDTTPTDGLTAYFTLE